jgi:hypothetical protein
LATKKVSVSIDESVFKSLASRFPDISDKQTIVETLARLALLEWDSWFAARLRPKTVSALAQERVQMIFLDRDLYFGKRVTRGVLFNQFNLPYGEASYLERVFAERDQPGLTDTTVQKIVDDLDGQLQAWSKDKNRKEEQGFTIEVNKLGQRLLQSMMQAAKEQGSPITTAEHISAVHGYYDYTFTKGDAQIILDTAQKFLKARTP